MKKPTNEEIRTLLNEAIGAIPAGEHSPLLRRLIDAHDALTCTCLSELEDDAYSPGGPMSGRPKPPACKLHRGSDVGSYELRRRNLLVD